MLNKKKDNNSIMLEVKLHNIVTISKIFFHQKRQTISIHNISCSSYYLFSYLILYNKHLMLGTYMKINTIKVKCH